MDFCSAGMVEFYRVCIVKKGQWKLAIIHPSREWDKCTVFGAMNGFLNQFLSRNFATEDRCCYSNI